MARYQSYDVDQVTLVPVLFKDQILLPWLMPLALGILEVDPVSEGDCYPGDLLASVLRAQRTFWEYDPELRGRVQRILEGLDELPKQLNDAIALFRTNTV